MKDIVLNKDVPVSAYEPSWNSLRKYTIPIWFRDAKFGIYTHWGIYSVPACGPNGSWYAYNMYREGTPQYTHHLKTYGHPSSFGYKDFIRLFGGEKFDPEEWAELFSKAGARFAGPVGEHHDGFAMWDTRHSKWNAAKMGPKRDVVGALERSIRKKGMRFMVSMHHAENWWFFPHWRKEYDTADAKYSGLYGESHNLEWEHKMPDAADWKSQWRLQNRPSKRFLDGWKAKIEEVIDRYCPDLLWFDFGLNFVQEHYKREMLAYYYNRARERCQDVVVTYKRHDLHPESGVVDLELGSFDELTYHPWITDTTVDAGRGWGYLKDTEYKSVETLVHYLVDNTSKNGLLLLNVGPKPSGEIPEQARNLLLGVGRWLEVNGEAIYGTTPWVTYGEGPTRMARGGMFSEEQGVKYTAEDIRFTVKDDALYAICLGWPGEEFSIRSVADKLYDSEIVSVKMLGTDEPLSWNMTREVFRVKLPTKKVCEHAHVLKIVRKHPFCKS